MLYITNYIDHHKLFQSIEKAIFKDVDLKCGHNIFVNSEWRVPKRQPYCPIIIILFSFSWFDEIISLDHSFDCRIRIS
jgi:hypothetical protein